MPSLNDIFDNEQIRRLELLEAYDILNTPPEPEFDDIVTIAAEVCHTPVALISLVESERQWFKARVGVDMCETPIAQSVCAHAMSGPEMLVINDLATDPRTRDNALVTGAPHIRFYAGAPLVSPGGVIVGSLCVIDMVPRPQGLDAAQQKVLAALSRQVVAHLEARRASHRKDELFRRQKGLSANIRATATKTLAAQEAGRIGTFEVDIATRMVNTSPEFCRIFDVDIAPSYPASLFENMLVAEDQGKQSSVKTRADGSASINVEYRIKTAHHGIRWVSRHAVFERDGSGKPVRMLGTVQDITDHKRATLRVQALLDLGDRLRNLETIEDMTIAAADLMGKALDAGRAGFGIVDPLRETVDMQPEWCAPGVASISGMHRFRDYGTFIDDLRQGSPVIINDVETDPRSKSHAQLLLDLGIRVMVNMPVFDHGRFVLVVFVHHNEPHVWTEQELSFIRSFGDRIQLAYARIQAEADQKTLNREIGHRLKNTFAMIQAIASQTLRPVTEREHVASFEKRLLALSKAHDILLNDQSEASVRAIVKSLDDTLALPGRLDIDGPDIVLGPKGALSLGLLLHELGTNAIKYGALSNHDGKVAIRWGLRENGPEQFVTFSWAEHGGPQPVPPARRGFGSKLIQLGLVGAGGVVMTYDMPGFAVEMSAALSQLQETG